MAKKQLDKQNFQKQPTVITSYERAFGENFIDMINALRNLDPRIANILQGDTEQDQYQNADQTYISALDVYNFFNDIFPDIINRKDVYTSLSISANRVILKTNMYFSIGWKFKYDKDYNITEIVATVTTFTKANKPDALDDMLKADEKWTVVEK